MAKQFVSNLVLGGKLNPSLQNAFSKASKIAGKTSAGISKMGSVASKAFSAIGAIGVGSAGLFGLVKVAESAIEAGDNVYRLSEKMNLTTKEASGLNRVLQLTGTESKPFISAMQRMDKSILTAGAKGNTTTKIMSAFGLKLTDSAGKLLPMNSQLDALAKGFDKAKEKGLENEYATAIFGAKAQSMIPLLQDYTEAKEVASKVKGIGVDPKAAHEAAINLKVMKMQFKQFGLVAGNAVMPLVSKLLPKITEVFSKIAEFIGSHQGVIKENIGKIGVLLEQVFAKIQPAISWVFNTGLPAVSGAVFKLGSFITNNWSKIEPLIWGIVGAIGAWKAITLGMQIYNTVMGAIRLATGAATVAQVGLNAAVLANPMTWIVLGVVAAIGVLVASIYLLWKHWDKVSAFMVGIWQNNVIPFFNGVGAWFGGIWTGVTDGFKAAWNGVKSWFVSLWEGIIGIVRGYLNIYVDIFNLVISGLNKIQFDVPQWVPLIGGKHIGVNIPNIPRFAQGGIATRPSIFGDDGPEAAIPLRRTKRSFNLLNQTSRILGAGSEKAQIVYAPIINGGNRAEIESLMQKSFEQFKTWYEQMQIDNGRFAY